MGEKREIPKILPIIFAISWLVLGFFTGEHLNNNLKFLGLLASILVLISMMVSLPFQRKECIVDGPGMPLFVIAWFIIIYLNSVNRTN